MLKAPFRWRSKALAAGLTTCLGLVLNSCTKLDDLAPPSCAYVVAPSSASFDHQGGAGSLSIQTGGTCSWTVASGDAWITIAGERSGQGDGAVSYSVAANAAPGPRSTTITVAAQAVTVSQTGAGPCSFAVAPTSAAIGAAGGSATATVTGPAACPWSATSQASWITISSGSGGAGNGVVTYVAAANTANTGRTGVITVAGQAVTVSQAGTAPACTYSVAPTSASFSASAGTGTVTATTQAGCVWTATSQATWITVSSGSAGTGTGSTAYAVAANTSPTGRTGTLTVAGQTVTVSQAAAAPACTYTVAPTAASFPVLGGSGTVNVDTQAGCAWTATSQAPWITITSGSPGSGKGDVEYFVTTNGTLSNRTGTITVAGLTVTISQSFLEPEVFQRRPRFLLKYR